ncbi:hypothetical protein AGMMS49944_08020 [Spirochaetia bacterium]|nr:hypothetical protein AGMMS49944_08020 [Spirochaetia bacterium]
MRKVAILTLLVLMAAGSAFARDNLAILPFSGGQRDEGEAIAELFSFDPRLNEFFTPIPRTSITSAMDREHGFQMQSGLTDVDTIAAIGQQLGAQYVMAGSITALGRRKLLVISIMKMDTLQQIAGDYQVYTRIEDIRRKLPQMMGQVIAAVQNNTDSFDKLAVVPVALQAGADEQVADTLAQLLAIHLLRSGSYTVYPRTKSLEQVQDEYDNQYKQAAEKNAVDVGHGENPHLVLSVRARTLGTVNMFNAAIIDLVDGTQIAGRSAEYSGIEDGMRAMEQLALDLTSSDEEKKLREAQGAGGWKNKWLYPGIRLGVSPHWYQVNTSSDLEVDVYPAFEAALSAEVQILKLFAMQTELIFSGDTVNATGDNGIGVTITSYTLTVPVLAKLTWRPHRFYAAAFAGPYFAIPLGPMEVKRNSQTETYDFTAPIGITGGANAGIKLGPGLLFLDFRYSGDFTYFWANDSAQFRRNMFTVSLGYNYGFINKAASRR